MDGFHGLFGTDNTAVSRLRGLGLNLTDNVPLFKETLVRYAVGLEGDLPQLAQMP